MSSENRPCCIGRCPDCGIGYFIFLSDGTNSEELFSREEGLIFLDVASEENIISYKEKEIIMEMIILEEDLIDTLEEASLWLKSTSPLGENFDMTKWIRTVEQICVKAEDREMVLVNN